MHLALALGFRCQWLDLCNFIVGFCVIVGTKRMFCFISGHGGPHPRKSLLARFAESQVYRNMETLGDHPPDRETSILLSTCATSTHDLQATTRSSGLQTSRSRAYCCLPFLGMHGSAEPHISYAKNHRQILSVGCLASVGAHNVRPRV